MDITLHCILSEVLSKKQKQPPKCTHGKKGR